MPATTGTVPNLINGISQQNPATRLTSQAESCENFYPTVVDELDRRPPSEHLAELGITLPAGAFTHFIFRDDAEKYILAIYPVAGTPTIKVWDLAGNEKTVTNSGSAYLTGLGVYENDLRALTIADHTFIVNKTKVVAAGTATSPTRPYEALIAVLAGNYGKTYNVSINTTLTAEYQTPDGSDASHAPYVDTVQIASQLYTDFVANGYNTGVWAVGRYHSTIYLRNTSFDFSISCADGYSGRAMKEAKGKAQKFSDLPSFGPQGFVIEVVGEEASNFDNYWVRFEKNNDDDNNSAGIWRECPAPGTVLGLDDATMPHILVRNADGTFTFKAAEWDDRKCGNAATVPDPSFVGQTIEDIFFHRNRLGVLTKENIVMSEAGKFYNFFRTTLTALLDSDPIDVAASHVKVSLLHHAVPFSDVLMIFSDQTQFRLQGNELLTPKTVNARPLSELTSHPRIRPVASGTSLYFLSERGAWATLVEYYIDKQVENADTEDVGAHAPAYIPAGARHLVASPDLDLVIVQSGGDPNALYLYKYYWNGQEKLQSAWVRWRFPQCDEIINAAFDKSILTLLMRRGSSLFVETIDCEQGRSDVGLDYTTFLDRRVLVEGGTYDSITDRTTFTLPYTAPSGLKCVTAYSASGSLPAGVELTPVSISGTSVVFSGDLHLDAVRFGILYTSEYEFSQFYQRDAQGKVADQDGRLQLLSMALNYNGASYFRVEVSCEGRPTRTYPFTGRIVSDPDNLTGALALDSGKFSFPIMSRNDRVSIKIINDTWQPSSFSSAKWRGVWNPGSRQQ
jgi:hypothetical protein